MMIYILKADYDGTTRSEEYPISAVTTEDAAKRFVNESDEGYSRSYQKIELKETWNEDS